MVKKLTRDLNVIQNSDIEVEIDPITADLNIIQKLDDEPNDVGGLTAQELKAKFDEAGNVIKTFINDSLIPQVAAETVSEAQREINETQRQENEAQRQANETARQEAEEARVAAEAAREDAARELSQELTERVDALEASVEEAEDQRNVWEPFNPSRPYVPGNKVYWAGSSYVNKVPCVGVYPNVAENWQMVAKRGETVGDGMTEEDCDERYLQLTGGSMTGQMTIQPPQHDESPVPKWYVRPEAIAVTKLPDKVSYYVGDVFDPEGMAVEAETKDGDSWQVLGYHCSPAVVGEDTDITVRYERLHGDPLSTTLPFRPSASLAPSFFQASLHTEQKWQAPVLCGDTWVMAPDPSANSAVSAYSKDGKTWDVAALPASQRWGRPVFADGMVVLTPIQYNRSSSSATAAYSEDGGRTWKSAALPVSQPWNQLVCADGTWVLTPYATYASSTAAYSEDGGKTWKSAALPSSAIWGDLVYGGGTLVLGHPNASSTYGKFSDLAYSEDGGKTWKSAALPASQTWAKPFYADGVWVLTPYDGAGYNQSTAACSEDGGKTWKSAALPSSSNWRPSVYGGGVLILLSLSVLLAYSEDRGKTWKSASLPASLYWNPPAYGGGMWVIGPSYSGNNSYNAAAYSEDGGKTWHSATLPVSQQWNAPVYVDGIWVLTPHATAKNSSGAAPPSDAAAYSEDGGKTWKSTTLPAAKNWGIPFYAAGSLVLIPITSSNVGAYSSDRGKTWNPVPMPVLESWNEPVFGGGMWELGPKPSVASSTAAYCPIIRTLAPLPGEEPAPVNAPPPSLEDRVNALSAENAALAAAVERGLSL